MRDVLLLVGAGQIGMAIARRIGFDKKIIIGDKNLVNAKKIADIMKGKDTFFVEDNPYGELRFKGEHQKSFGAYLGETTPKTKIGFVISACLNSNASSKIATQKPAAPTLSATLATSTAPCP